ncbi:DUF3093 family protein [Microcella putealis]|uniref:DUF3093 family protein n=1 Tax=Microcella putealis TaxID=337005 RepID=A0A4Q7LJH2_9MICO|nr:DUF3093 domain-containing protein [Microcella putealis]RZS54291.1 DUF3093 family protein [Microcella putealis]TQM24955.1 DUF3093 family protein [Microcella putealis]
MELFRERLWPALWWYPIVLLIVPATLLIFAAIDLLAGVVTAAVLVAGALGLLIGSAPTIRIADGTLTAGRARIPVELTGDARGASGEEARAERGVRLDARAWLLLRGDVGPVVRVEITDPDDPTPYWLVSTRRPDELVAALSAAKASV